MSVLVTIAALGVAVGTVVVLARPKTTVRKRVVIKRRAVVRIDGVTTSPQISGDALPVVDAQGVYVGPTIAMVYTPDAGPRSQWSGTYTNADFEVARKRSLRIMLVDVMADIIEHDQRVGGGQGVRFEYRGVDGKVLFVVMVDRMADGRWRSIVDNVAKTTRVSKLAATRRRAMREADHAVGRQGG